LEASTLSVQEVLCTGLSNLSIRLNARFVLDTYYPIIWCKNGCCCLVAHGNKHCWRAFQRYQQRWP